MIIEGTERTLAELALAVLLDRAMPREMRNLNVERFSAAEIESMIRISEATQAMPFLADCRIVIVTETQTLRAAARRELWEIAQSVPAGNMLVLLDLLAPKVSRPQPFGQLAGRSALRIDTTTNEAVRERYIRETLLELGAQADVRIIHALSRSDAELAAVRNDLEKLALGGKRITLAALARESLSVEDPKAYQYASALVEERSTQALTIAFDMFANDPRSAAIPLISALAAEYALLWEIARRGGRVPAKAKWRERFLRPVATRMGERRARLGFECALHGFETIVTGKVDEPRLLVEMLTAELGRAK